MDEGWRALDEARRAVGRARADGEVLAALDGLARLAEAQELRIARLEGAGGRGPPAEGGAPEPLAELVERRFAFGATVGTLRDVLEAAVERIIDLDRRVGR